MATFKFYREGYGIMYNEPNKAPFSRRIDMPSLIANGGLANTSDVKVTLPTTGFAASDILQVFQVPAGFQLQCIGIRVVTAEGAACTAKIGNLSATQTHVLGANDDGYVASANFNSATTQLGTVASDGLGPNTGAGTGLMGIVFVTNGSIDITFGSADTNAFIADIWATGAMVF